MNVNTSITPVIPKSLKFTAQGYMKITSMSKSTNKIATKKYLMANGKRAFPSDSTPHSKESNLIFVLRFGPNQCDAIIVVIQIRVQLKTLKQLVNNPKEMKLCS